MKIKENFVLRQVADTWVVLPLGQATVDFKGMLTLNESGILLWRLLEKGTTREALAAALTEEYEVSENKREGFSQLWMGLLLLGKSKYVGVQLFIDRVTYIRYSKAVNK